MPPRESARLLGEPEPALEDSPIVSVHLWFDRHAPARRRSPRCSARTRTGCSTAARSPAHAPERGQYLTVVSSGVPELLEVRGRELVERIAGQLTERLGDAELLWSRVSREPYATIALRPGVERPGVETDAAGRRARRRVDRHRLARDDGERGAQRPRGGSASLEHRVGESYGMTALRAELTGPRPARSTAARAACSSCSGPTASGSASSSRT